MADLRDAPQPSARVLPNRSLAVVLLLAGCLAFLGGFHNFLLAAKYGFSLSDGHFIHFHTDEYHKMAEIFVALKGHYMVGNPCLLEEYSAPASNTPFAGSLAALIFRILHIDFAATTWFFDFLIPPIAFLVVLWFHGRLFPSAAPFDRRIASFLFVLIFLLAPTQRSMMRYMHAQLTLPIFVWIFLATTTLAAGRLKGIGFGLLTALNAASAWLDPWYALVLTATQVLLAVITLVKGDSITASRLAIVALAAVIGGIPETLRLMALSNEPGFKMLTERQGAMATFVPSYPKYMAWLAILSLISGVAYRLHLLKRHGAVFGVALVTLAVCTAIYFQNLVTWRRLYFQGEHVAGKALLPAGILISAILVSALGRLREKFGKRSAYAAALTLVLSAIAHHGLEVPKPIGWSAPADYADPIYGLDPLQKQVQYASAFAWLSRHVPDTAVVLCDPTTDLILKIRADKFAYASQVSVHISLDQEGLNTRLYPFLWMRPRLRIPTSEDPIWRMHEYLRNYNPRDYNLVYCSAGSALPHQVRVNGWLASKGMNPAFDETKARTEFQSHIDRLYAGYDAFLASRHLVGRDTSTASPESQPADGIRDLLAFRCDYVLWGPQEKFFYPEYDPAADPTLAQIWSDEVRGTVVYRILPTTS